jgi:hypothetical protein
MNDNGIVFANYLLVFYSVFRNQSFLLRPLPVYEKHNVQGLGTQ